MDNIFSQKVINANNLFDNGYLDAKSLYLNCFNKLPSINFVRGVDGEKALEAIREKFADKIQNIYQNRFFERSKKAFRFNGSIVVFKWEMAIDIESDYCEILHNDKNTALLEEIVATALQFKARQRREPLEINLIVQEQRRLALKAMEIKRTKLDLGLFYADEFAAVDQLIQRRLRNKNDKGIVLLHGLPGTGKTSYLRYLVGKIRKRVLFLSPSVAGNLMNPEFIELLIDNPNTVVLVEDAENIIMDRRQSSNSSVSNLLNISDGLLADFLNVQLICTFNSALTNIDQALLRKGRLIARYEFGKLSVSKAQKLSDHLGFSNQIDRPMTLAELSNPGGQKVELKETNSIGFRHYPALME